MFGDCHDPVAFQTIQTGHTSTLPDTDLNIQVPLHSGNLHGQIWTLLILKLEVSWGGYNVLAYLVHWA